MYLEGDLVKVHANGRINYGGKETLADGSDPLAETAARAAELVDRAAKKAEVRARCTHGGDLGVSLSLVFFLRSVGVSQVYQRKEVP